MSELFCESLRANVGELFKVFSRFFVSVSFTVGLLPHFTHHKSQCGRDEFSQIFVIRLPLFFIFSYVTLDARWCVSITLFFLQSFPGKVTGELSNFALRISQISQTKCFNYCSDYILLFYFWLFCKQNWKRETKKNETFLFSFCLQNKVFIFYLFSAFSLRAIKKYSAINLTV